MRFVRNLAVVALLSPCVAACSAGNMSRISGLEEDPATLRRQNTAPVVGALTDRQREEAQKPDRKAPVAVAAYSLPDEE
ncbi:MAG TPA: hypothetical protein VHP58_02150 [Alphaproteobacteria bacterium]|nr:hypothetical protein [Alphaproteobacteria bacterium]